MKKDKTALIVFAREPKDGRVKTRLSKDLPKPVVTNLYKAFVKDVLRIARQTRCDQRFLYYVGNGSSIPFLKKNARGFQLRRQTGKDLGERMHRAFQYCQSQRFERITIIGTDCLTVRPTDIEQAFGKLKKVDYVIGPSRDGGYYLIALKSPHRSLFRGIRWGTASVLPQTSARIRRLNKKSFLLMKKEDIDTPRQLQRFRKLGRELGQAPCTRKILQKISYSAGPA